MRRVTLPSKAYTEGPENRILAGDPKGDARMADHLITSDPGGRPVIAGTHVTVEEVLKELATSEAVDVILTAHPELDRAAVQAALEYAAEKMHSIASTPSAR